MTPRASTRDALLAYVRADTEPKWRQKIVNHMWKQYKTSPAAVRQQLQRLCRDGELEQVEPGRYRIRHGA